MIRFTDDAQMVAMEPTIRSHPLEAMGYAAAGIAPPKEAAAIDLPDEPAEALDADSEPAEAFRALTPGRRRSYVINRRSAKKPETRISRIAAFRDRIIAARGAQER